MAVCMTRTRLYIVGINRILSRVRCVALLAVHLAHSSQKFHSFPRWTSQRITGTIYAIQALPYAKYTAVAINIPVAFLTILQELYSSFMFTMSCVETMLAIITDPITAAWFVSLMHATVILSGCIFLTVVVWMVRLSYKTVYRLIHGPPSRRRASVDLAALGSDVDPFENPLSSA